MPFDRAYGIVFMKILLVSILFFFSSITENMAYAQSVRQSGPVTASHAACWTYNGIVQDCGPSTLPFATSFGVWGTGTPFCVLNTQITTANQYTQPYYQLCLGYLSGSTAATLSLAPFNGAPNIPFDVILNGTVYPFPSSVPYAASPLRTVASGTTDSVNAPDQNGTIAWNSNSAAPKTETLLACSSSINGFNVTIKDEYGSAGTYPITITSSSNIDGQSTYIMAFNYQAVRLQCDGSTTHWVVT